MSGSILQLKSTGAQDVFLTGNPEVNFIRQVYKRYVNFASEPIHLYAKGEVKWGGRVTIDVPKSGDFLHRISIAFKLPPLVPKTAKTYAGWTNSLGHVLLNCIDFEIGGLASDTNYGLYMEI